LGENGAWAYTGTSQFFPYPVLSQQRIKLRTSNLASIFTAQGPSEQKPFKIFGENGAWAYTGTAQFFSVPPIISGTGKATNFNFCTHILSIDRNKSLLQISGKVARCVVRTLKTFQGTHILGASRGLLCDSSAVLFIYASLVSITGLISPGSALVRLFSLLINNRFDTAARYVTDVCHTLLLSFETFCIYVRRQNTGLAENKAAYRYSRLSWWLH